MVNDKIMKSKNKLRWIRNIIAIVFVFCLLSVPTMAATPKTTKLENNKTYKTYDLDGDKKKDSIILKTSKGGYIASFYINGKKVYTIPKSDGMFPEYQILCPTEL